MQDLRTKYRGGDFRSSKTSTSYKNNKKAFTLVELIVVITILLILGAIAFISLQGLTKDARDTKRFTDIRNLYSKIVVENARGVDLEDLLDYEKTNSGLTINTETKTSEQGIVNFANLKENPDNFKDPNGQDYVFGYAKGTITKEDGEKEGYTFIQLATISEKENTSRLVGNYFKYDGNDSKSILIDDLGNELEDGGEDLAYNVSTEPENGNCGTSNGITTNVKPSKDLCTSGKVTSITYNSGKWTWLCKGKNGGTDSNICEATSNHQMCNGVGLYDGNVNSRYSGCDKDDIIMCIGEGEGYTLAACNVGTTIAGTGAESYGSHFLWGNNYPFSSSGALDSSLIVSEAYEVPTGTQPSTYSNGKFVVNSDVIANWAIGDEETLANLWGGVTRTEESQKGPCAEGYHIPLSTDWVLLASRGGWLKTTKINDMSDTLLIPLAGRRYTTNGGLTARGVVAHLHCADQYTLNNVYRLLLDSNNNIRLSNYYKSVAISVRCFKN